MTTRGAVARDQDQGSGTVLALGIIATLMLLLAVVQALSAVAVAHAQSARAADLAALAAADAARGLYAADPCTVAEHVAARNEAVLEHCTVGGDHPAEVQLRVSRSVDIVPLPRQLSLPQLHATASARAGPPEALPR